MTGNGLGRRFWVLWAAVTSANLGDGLTLVAFPLLAAELTDDARSIAVVTAFRFLPFVTVGLPAGVLLDRFDRRRLAVVAQMVRTIGVGGLVAALLVEQATVWLLALVAFVVGVGEILTDGGLPAMVRALVDDARLEVANARVASTQVVTNAMIGPPLGALLFEVGDAVPFTASLVLFAATSLILFRLDGRFVAPRPTEPSSLGGSIAEGLRYVWNHPVLRPLAFAVALFSFCGQATNAMYVVLATERLGLGSVGFGALLAVDATASLLASLLVARFIGRVGSAGSMRFAVIAFASAMVLLGSTTVPVVAVAAAVLQGLGDPTWNVVSGTLRQRLVPDEVFGRMITAYLFIAWSLNPIGAMTGGVVAEAFGVQWVYLGAAVIVGSLLVVGRPLFARVAESDGLRVAAAD